MTNRNNPFGEGYLTAEQKEHQARAWAETSPNASAARKEILRIVSEAPIHTACLGEFGERFQIPKPVSSVIRELCGNLVSFYTAKMSPTGSPALALTERASDNRYWAHFRRKGLEAASETDGVNPWAMLGIGTIPQPCGGELGNYSAVRARIFAAFMAKKYGYGVIKGMSAVCIEFKKVSGVSFSSFFDGMRPADFMNSPQGRMYFNWSWTTATPPCLNCELKRGFSQEDGGGNITPSPDLVGALVPVAMKDLPEGIDFYALQRRFNCSESEVFVAYLYALKKAIQLKVAGTKEYKPSVTTEEAVKQLLDVSRTLADVANRIAAIAERLLASAGK